MTDNKSPSRKRKIQQLFKQRGQMSLWDQDPDKIFNQVDQLNEELTFNVRVDIFNKLQGVVQILKKASEMRQKKEIYRLDNYFKDNLFFKNLTKDTDKETCYHCFKVMDWKPYQSGDVVCYYGDVGTQFYIILRGEVSVKIPTTFESEFTQDELFLFCLQYFEDIEWQKLPQGEHLRHEINSEIQRFGINYNNRSERISYVQEKLKKKEFSVPFGISEIMDGKKQAMVKMWVFKEVATLKEGKSFGELALMTSKPRAATIQCKKDTDLAILDKKDYQIIVGNAMKRQVNEKVKFFKNFRIFQTLSKNKMQRMLYYFHEKVYQRKQVVYMEGIDTTDGVYFIKSGEFDVSKKVKIEKNLDPKLNQITINDTLKKTLKLNSEKNAIKSDISLKHVRLCLLGQNEIFGLEEVAENKSRRLTTVVCASSESVVYFIKREDFINSVNLFKFSDKIIQEKYLRQQFINMRLGETETFRMKKMEQYEYDRKNKILVQENLKTLNLQVNKEFNQQQFQQATKKIISDKKTLIFSPTLLNKKLKFIKNKGELERQERLQNKSQDYGFITARSDEKHSPRKFSDSPRQVKISKLQIEDPDEQESLKKIRSNERSPPKSPIQPCFGNIEEKVDDQLEQKEFEFQQRILRKNMKSMSSLYKINENHKLITREQVQLESQETNIHKTPMKNMRTYQTGVLASIRNQRSTQFSPTGAIKTLDEDQQSEDPIMQIQSIPGQQPQVHQVFNIPHSLEKIKTQYKTMKNNNHQQSWMNRPLVQIRKKLKTSLPSRHSKTSSIVTLQTDVNSRMTQKNYNNFGGQQHSATNYIISKRNSMEQLGHAYSAQISQLQSMQSSQNFILPNVSPLKKLSSKASSTLKFQGQHQAQDCNTCVFCRKQVSRQLITRPVTKGEVEQKDRKEKIIIFREKLVKNFNKKQVKDTIDQLMIDISDPVRINDLRDFQL